MHRTSWFLLCLAVASAQDTPIQADRIAAHVKVLGSDEYEGRAPATRAEKKTVEYLVGQFQAFGLEPAGDMGPKGRAWTQDVPLSQADVAGPVSASIKMPGGSKTLRQGEDIAIRATHLKTDHIKIQNAPLVFVGYGVKAPERQWDDYKGIDMHGKIGVVLINDPDFEADLGGRFNGKAMTYYGRWTYKYEEAARQGALGMIVIHETDPASYGWATVKNSNTNTMFDIVRPRPQDVHPLMEAWIQRGVAVEMFRAAGLDFEAEKKKAQSADFRPVVIKDTSLSADYRVKHAQVISKNVVAMKKGSTHADEFVFYTAHWDHLGIGQPDAKGDRIYNGAEDNALGTASILEVARRFASQPATERSVVLSSVRRMPRRSPAFQRTRRPIHQSVRRMATAQRLVRFPVTRLHRWPWDASCNR